MDGVRGSFKGAALRRHKQANLTTPNSLPPPTALVYAGFVLTGVLTTLLGPMLPILSRRFNLNDSRAGLFFVAQFVGSTLGAILTSKLSFLTTRDKLLAGYLLLTIGVPGMIGNWGIALAGVSCYGLGLGLVIPTTNIAIAEGSLEEKRGSALNLLNFAWVCGAVLCGPLVRLLSDGDNPTKFLLVITSGLCVITASFLLASNYSGAHVADNLITLEDEDRTKEAFTATLWFGVLLFLYVGLENSIAGWASSYSERLGVTEKRALLVPSFFWAAILTGRLLSYVLLKRVNERWLFRMALITATSAIASMLSTSDPVATTFAVAIAGLGLAPIFPLVILLFTQQFGLLSSRFAGQIFALGGLGGALLPFATGVLSSHFQSLRYGLTACLVAVCCICFVVWRLDRNGMRLRDLEHI